MLIMKSGTICEIPRPAPPIFLHEFIDIMGILDMLHLSSFYKLYGTFIKVKDFPFCENLRILIMTMTVLILSFVHINNNDAD